jgi:cytoskeletal protein CcmA (bactofilin family)
MFGKAKEKDKGQRQASAPARIETLIGASSTLTGDLVFSGGLHLEGKVVGNIKSAPADDNALLILDEHGMIEGDVKVPNMVINGTVTGDLHSTGQLELASGARIHGNVYYNLVEMAVGAQINGNLVHRSESETRPAAAKAATGVAAAGTEVKSGMAGAKS